MVLGYRMEWDCTTVCKKTEIYFLDVSTFVTMKFMNPANSKQQIQYGLVWWILLGLIQSGDVLRSLTVRSKLFRIIVFQLRKVVLSYPVLLTVVFGLNTFGL